MASRRNKFTDPESGDSYEWHINHNEEESHGRSRNITASAPTGNVGLVRQQGEQEPFVLKLRGVILHRTQYREFWKWFQRCDSRSVNFRDFDDQQYKVIITSLNTKREMKAKVVGGDLECHVFKYEMEMQVLEFYGGGDLDDVDLVP